MLIQNLLEGTIKVPERFLNETKAVATGHVMSQIMTYINTDEGQDYFDNITYIKKFIRQKQAEYGDFPITVADPTKTTKGEVVLRAADVPARYLNRAPSFKQQTVDVIVKNSEKLAWGLYAPKEVGYAPAVIVHSPSMDGIRRVAQSPELLPAMFNKLDSVIEHELMHAIQDLILKTMVHKDDVGVDTETGEITDIDKYMSDPDEFSPMIISHAHEFKGLLNTARAGGWHMTNDEVRTLFRRFVNPSSPRNDDIDIVTPDFFDVLYRKKPKQWKIAVKYLHDKLSGVL